ncbi:MAG: hypothetical protein QGH39_12180 [Candidatus Thermoplasmatota archaeon]|jgi:hypothetical protein|nr:hypothetical protein [Candidatus Thermoplasmatota archaeon]MDP7266303.1 hypothetical protein [Candidatus Thermoplasmatota archaeon]
MSEAYKKWHWKVIKGAPIPPDQIVARIIAKGEEKERKFIFKKDMLKDMTIEPNECAVIVTDGKVEDVITQTRIKKLFGILDRKKYKILFMDIAPIELIFPVIASTKDHMPIKGKCTLRFTLSSENATQVLTLMRAKSLLTKKSLQQKIYDEIVSMVFKNRIAKYSKEEFHGNVDIIKDMETAAMIEMRKTFAMWGMSVVKMFTNWKKTMHDAVEEHRTKADLKTSKHEIDHDAWAAKQQRKHDKVEKLRQDKWDLRRGEVSGKESLKTTHMDASIERDKMKHEHKIDKSKDIFDEQLRRKKSVAELEAEQDARELEQAMGAKQQLNAMKMARQQQAMDHQNAQMGMQTGAMQSIMQQAISSGAADSGSLQEMMRQMTMQKALDREGSKVKDLSTAEAQRHNLDTYKAAEDREREHQINMNKEAAHLMEASKQQGPQTLVQGGGGVSTKMHVDANTPPPPGSACWNCGKTVEPDFAMCPFCGESLK